MSTGFALTRTHVSIAVTVLVAAVLNLGVINLARHPVAGPEEVVAADTTADPATADPATADPAAADPAATDLSAATPPDGPTPAPTSPADGSETDPALPTPALPARLLTYESDVVGAVTIALRDEREVSARSVTPRPGWTHRVVLNGPDTVHITFTPSDGSQGAEFNASVITGELAVQFDWAD
jgi:hypothetical protein